MSHIFYKFKSAKDYDGYRFEGAGVPVWELKKEIVLAKKLGKTADFDLILSNAQTNEGRPLSCPLRVNCVSINTVVDYTDEMTVIPKNAQVVVRRVPLAAGKKSALSFTAKQQNNGPGGFARPFHSAPNWNTGGLGGGIAVLGEEEKKIRAMMQASGSHWEQNQQEDAPSTDGTSSSLSSFKLS